MKAAEREARAERKAARKKGGGRAAGDEDEEEDDEDEVEEEDGAGDAVVGSGVASPGSASNPYSIEAIRKRQKAVQVKQALDGIRSFHSPENYFFILLVAKA